MKVHIPKLNDIPINIGYTTVFLFLGGITCAVLLLGAFKTLPKEVYMIVTFFLFIYGFFSTAALW